MPTTDIGKIKEQLSRVLTVIEPANVEAILTLHKRLAKEHIPWAIGGDLGEALRAVPVKPDCVEVWTNKKGAAQILMAFKDLAPKGVYFQTQRLERKAIVGEKLYPIYQRSYYFDFMIQNVKIRVHGDLQFRVGDWEWGDKLEYTPEHVSIVGFKTAVVPLQVKYELYHNLGWADRAERVSQVINRHPSRRQGDF